MTGMSAMTGMSGMTGMTGLTGMTAMTKTIYEVHHDLNYGMLGEVTCIQISWICNRERYKYKDIENLQALLFYNHAS